MRPFLRHSSVGSRGVTTAGPPQCLHRLPLERLPQRLPCKAGENKASLMNIFVIVPAQLLLFLYAPAPEGCFHIPIFGFAAHHKSDLATRVCRDSGVCILDGGKYFFAGFLEVGNKG